MNPMTQHRGFSLIELLVVISIVALLIGILLPALGAAREATRTAVCSSNTRQLAIAANVFAQDFEDHLPSAQDTQNPDLPSGYQSFWYGGGNFNTGDFRPDLGVMHGYLGNVDVAGCPTLDDDTRSFQGPVDYAYNVNYLGLIQRDSSEKTRRGVSNLKVRNPTETVMFFDGGRISDPNPAVAEFERTGFGFPPSGNAGPPGFQVPGGKPAVPIPSFHGRHGGKGGLTGGRVGVVAWVDGHVSRRKPSQYPGSAYGPLGGLRDLAVEFNIGEIDVDDTREGPVPIGGAATGEDDVLFDYD